MMFVRLSADQMVLTRTTNSNRLSPLKLSSFRRRERFAQREAGAYWENAFDLASHLGAKIIVNMEGEQH